MYFREEVYFRFRYIFLEQILCKAQCDASTVCKLNLVKLIIQVDMILDPSSKSDKNLDVIRLLALSVLFKWFCFLTNYFKYPIEK